MANSVGQHGRRYAGVQVLANTQSSVAFCSVKSSSQTLAISQNGYAEACVLSQPPLTACFSLPALPNRVCHLYCPLHWYACNGVYMTSFKPALFVWQLLVWQLRSGQ